MLLIDSNNNSERIPHYIYSYITVCTHCLCFQENHTFFNHRSAFQLERQNAQPYSTQCCEYQIAELAPVPWQ